jgi:hypothetical protein
MENTNTINNNETKSKKVYSEAQIRDVKAFHERHRNSSNTDCSCFLQNQSEMETEKNEVKEEIKKQNYI